MNRFFFVNIICILCIRFCGLLFRFWVSINIDSNIHMCGWAQTEKNAFKIFTTFGKKIDATKKM